MKVAISASPEAFLCQKSKKEQHQQVVHLLTYNFLNKTTCNNDKHDNLR